MSQPDQSLFRRWLARSPLFGKREASSAVVEPKWSRRVGAGLKFATYLYLLLLAAWLVLMDRLGERNWIFSLLLFLPPQGWLLPLVVLTPLCFIFRRGLCWVHLLIVVGLFLVYLDFRWSRWPPPGGPTLTLLTNNIGGREIRTLSQFIESENADIIALQDCRVFQVRPLNLERHGRSVAGVGEFVLASKFPIKKSGLVPALSYQHSPVAAWFEVDYEGKSIVIYSVHMPTPRKEFAKLRGRGLWAELRGGKGIFSREVRESFRQFVTTRQKLADDLVDVLRAEKRSFLVAGDFNMPDHGYLYRRFASHFTDTFAATGRGYGFTFPGATRNPLSLFSPWLRLDYLFAGENWHPIYCRVESHQAGEHQAVVGRFEFVEAKRTGQR